mgnify:CR=1 FL=1
MEEYVPKYPLKETRTPIVPKLKLLSSKLNLKSSTIKLKSKSNLKQRPSPYKASAYSPIITITSPKET